LTCYITIHHIMTIATIQPTDNLWNSRSTINDNFTYLDTIKNIWEFYIPQNPQSANYTLTLSDAWRHIYHPTTDTTARTWTIPANSVVAFPVGTTISFVNDTWAGNITIAINTDTMVFDFYWFTWSRTLAPNWIATILKVTSTRRFISWSNLS